MQQVEDVYRTNFYVGIGIGIVMNVYVASGTFDDVCASDFLDIS